MPNSVSYELVGRRTMSGEAEPTRTLWMLVYSEDDINHKLKPFYAVSEEDAEKQVQEWIEQIGYKVTRIGLRAYPNGFTIQYTELPGKMQTKPSSNNEE